MLIQNYALNFVAQWPAGSIQIIGQNWIQKSMNFWLDRVVVPNLPEKDLGPVTSMPTYYLPSVATFYGDFRSTFKRYKFLSW